jgi:hypothetical protein
MSDRCTAKSKRTGRRCGQLVPGGGVCRWHGGAAGHVEQKRRERVVLAKALAADPRRDPAEVLADVLHQADHLMRKAREEVDADRPTASTMLLLLEMTERAGSWAKSALDAGVQERQTRALEAQVAVLAGVISRVLDRLELTPAQRELVPTVVPAELERVSTLGVSGG